MVDVNFAIELFRSFQMLFKFKGLVLTPQTIICKAHVVVKLNSPARVNQGWKKDFAQYRRNIITYNIVLYLRH